MKTSHRDVPDEPTPRDLKMAQALAMVHAGTAERAAARAVGIPRSTLRDQLAYLRTADGSRERRLREYEEEILDVTFISALTAQEELARRVIEEPKKIPTKELVTIAGVAQDKLNMRRGWSKGGLGGEGNGIGSLAAKLAELGGGTVTVDVDVREEGRGEQAVEVEGTRVEE